jgi:hypothetical protein
VKAQRLLLTLTLANSLVLVLAAFTMRTAAEQGDPTRVVEP